MTKRRKPKYRVRNWRDYNKALVSRGSLTVWVDSRSTDTWLGHDVVDSTGLKVYGEGEWKVRLHGYDKRRTWRKLHAGIGADSASLGRPHHAQRCR